MQLVDIWHHHCFRSFPNVFSYSNSSHVKTLCSQLSRCVCCRCLRFRVLPVSVMQSVSKCCKFIPFTGELSQITTFTYGHNWMFFRFACHCCNISFNGQRFCNVYQWWKWVYFRMKSDKGRHSPGPLWFYDANAMFVNVQLSTIIWHIPTISFFIRTVMLVD